MKFKTAKEQTYSDDPTYDLIHGGYINPRALLEDEDEAKKVEDAVEIVQQFLDEATECGAIEVG